MKNDFSTQHELCWFLYNFLKGFTSEKHTTQEFIQVVDILTKYMPVYCLFPKDMTLQLLKEATNPNFGLAIVEDYLTKFN